MTRPVNVPINRRITSFKYDVFHNNDAELIRLSDRFLPQPHRHLHFIPSPVLNLKIIRDPSIFSAAAARDRGAFVFVEKGGARPPVYVHSEFA